MANETIARADLVVALKKEVGLSQRGCLKLIEGVLNEITDALVSGENVNINGFSSFTVRQKKARTGRNPNTLEEALITPRRVVIFRASRVLKAKINGSRD